MVTHVLLSMTEPGVRRPQVPVTPHGAHGLGRHWLSRPPRHANANNAALTFERLGSPEGGVALGPSVVYRAAPAKGNAGYNAYKEARAYVKTDKSRAVPVHLRNAPTELRLRPCVPLRPPRTPRLCRWPSKRA